MGWHFLEDIDKCKVMMYQFMYYYDNINGLFKVTTDLKSYTVGDMTWDFIEEYDIYNIKIEDHTLVRIVTDGDTGQEIGVEEPLPIKNQIPRIFDVSKYGEYVSLLIF